MPSGIAIEADHFGCCVGLASLCMHGHVTHRRPPAHPSQPQLCARLCAKHHLFPTAEVRRGESSATSAGATLGRLSLFFSCSDLSHPSISAIGSLQAIRASRHTDALQGAVLASFAATLLHLPGSRPDMVSRTIDCTLSRNQIRPVAVS